MLLFSGMTATGYIERYWATSNDIKSCNRILGSRILQLIRGVVAKQNSDEKSDREKMPTASHSFTPCQDQQPRYMRQWNVTIGTELLMSTMCT